MFEYVQANAGIEIESCELRDGFLVLRKTGPTPAGFPRRVGVARKRPLG